MEEAGLVTSCSLVSPELLGSAEPQPELTEAHLLGSHLLLQK